MVKPMVRVEQQPDDRRQESRWEVGAFFIMKGVKVKPWRGFGLKASHPRGLADILRMLAVL